MRKTRSFLEMIAAPISLLLIIQVFATTEAAQPVVPAALESTNSAESTSPAMVADFEDGFPTGWFQYADGIAEATAEVIMVTEGAPMALPGQVGSNNVLSVTANVPTWAGLGAVPPSAEDWSNYDGISFWFYGENSSTTLEFEIQTAQGDNRQVKFVDDFIGWQLLASPFTIFGTTAYDVSQVNNWVLVLDGTVGSFKLDDISAFGNLATPPMIFSNGFEDLVVE